MSIQKLVNDAIPRSSNYRDKFHSLIERPIKAGLWCFSAISWRNGESMHLSTAQQLSQYIPASLWRSWWEMTSHHTGLIAAAPSQSRTSRHRGASWESTESQFMGLFPTTKICSLCVTYPHCVNACKTKGVFTPIDRLFCSETGTSFVTMLHFLLGTARFHRATFQSGPKCDHVRVIKSSYWAVSSTSSIKMIDKFAPWAYCGFIFNCRDLSLWSRHTDLPALSRNVMC